MKMGGGQAQGQHLGTGGRGRDWAPLEARVDEGLSRTPPSGPKSRAASLGIWVWVNKMRGHLNSAESQGCNPLST